MESKKMSEGFFIHFLHRITSSDLTPSEYLFFFLATLSETVLPILCYFLFYDLSIAVQAVIIMVLLLTLFWTLMDIHTFFQKNHVDYLYLQLIIFVLILLVSDVFFIINRDAIAAALKMDLSTIYKILAIMILILLYNFVIFVFMVAYDIGAVLILILCAKLLDISLKNPYTEQLKAARTLEGFKQDTRERIKAEYEREMFVPEPLFDHTKYFRQITDLEQVKPRYHALMKIYHPDNTQSDTIRICQEIQDEYQEIAKRYNL